MHQLKIRCFGTLNISKDNQVITQFDTDKARALLVYLVLEHHRSLTRSHLAGMLWSDLSEKQALQSLRQTLSILRKTLGEFSSQPLILAEKDVLQINPDIPIWVDVFAFQDEFSKATQYFQRKEQYHRINFRRLKNAMELKSGIFLDNFSIASAPLFDEWLILTREKLDHQASEGLNLLVDYYQKRGEFGLARQTVQKILQITPWDESAHLLMMRLFAMDGQWSALENQYRSLRRFLKDQLGVEPSQTTVTFFNEVRTKRSLKPDDISHHKHLTNLSTPQHLFIGRQKELGEISDLIVNPACRLVTIHGSGGIGKTSLAIEIAHQQLGIYPDGVFFVPLSAVHSFDELLTSFIETFKIPFQETGNSTIRLIEYLRNKKLLLVLDNFEQLQNDLQCRDFISRLLNQTHSLIIIMTSRERLNLKGEYVYSLTGMNFPEVGNIEKLDHVEKFDALELFIHRARQVKPDFELDDNSLAAAIKICQLFEGLPLGVELAAADVWSHSCQTILEKISSNLNALMNTSSDVPERYQSLWANLDVSWQLMDKPSRSIFARLGIFQNGFTLQAARMIAKIDEDKLTSFINQSLLHPNSNNRYRMHYVIQQYAQEKLNQIEEFSQTQQEFIKYFTVFLQEKRNEFEIKIQKTTLDDIQLELNNLKICWQWAMEYFHFDDLASMLKPLYLFFSIRSRFQEGIDLFASAIPMMEETLKVYAEIDKKALLGLLLSRMGAFAHNIRKNEQAREYTERALKLFLELNQQDEIAFSRSVLSDIYLRAKDFQQAELLAQQNLTYFQNSQQKEGLSKAYYMLGLIDIRRGKILSSKEYLLNSLLASRATGNPRRKMLPLNLLGDIYCVEGDYEKAAEIFKEGLEIAEELEDQFQKAILLNNLASVYHVNQDYPKASEMYAKSLSICRQLGDLDGEAIALSNLGEIALGNSDYVGAISLFKQALRISQETGEEWSIAVCLNNLADAYCRNGQMEKVIDQIKEGIQISLKNDASHLLTRLAITAGRYFQLQGSLQLAEEIYLATLAHSSTEYDLREKAIDYCKELGVETQPEPDDDLLGQVIKRII